MYHFVTFGSHVRENGTKRQSTKARRNKERLLTQFLPNVAPMRMFPTLSHCAPVYHLGGAAELSMADVRTSILIASPCAAIFDVSSLIRRLATFAKFRMSSARRAPSITCTRHTYSNSFNLLQLNPLSPPSLIAITCTH